jgi:hypothetical protein
MNMAGSWKFTFYFIERTHEPLHLDKLSFVNWKVMDIPTTFIWIIIFFDWPFEYGSGSKFEVMLGQILNYFVQNFGQCHIFVSYLSCYC